MEEILNIFVFCSNKIYEKSIVYNKISFKKFTDNLYKLIVKIFIIPVCLNTTDLSGVKQVTLLA